MALVLLVGIYFAYRYWKRNYAGKGGAQVKARPDPEPDKTHLQPPTPTGTHQEPHWNDQTLPSQGPHSFENPVFQDHPGSHELTETTYPSEEIYDGHQLPPGNKTYFPYYEQSHLNRRLIIGS